MAAAEERNELTWGGPKCALCCSCRSLVYRPLGSTSLQRDPMYRTWEDLFKLHATGECPLCHAISQACYAFDTPLPSSPNLYHPMNELAYRISDPSVLAILPGSADWYISIREGNHPQPHASTSVDLIVYHPLGSIARSAEGHGVGEEAVVPFDIRLDGNGSLNAQSISFIQKQLASCLTSSTHSNCDPAPNFPTERPRRILQIRGEKVWLVDFNTPMSGKFAALSYCWGNRVELRRNPPLQLTISTLNKLRSGIRLSELPLTLRQAVMVCGYLNLAYIWIDALCILQDDPSDWASEAKKMATVYTMATVTIIAASSTSCHSGFLSTSLNSVTLNSSLRPSLNLIAQRASKSGFHGSLTEGKDHIDNRGWTFQEEVLSTRYIKFTKDDIQWKCNARTLCVCRQPLHSTYDPSPEWIKSPWEDWDRIVEAFSKRCFTVDMDKLPALSGLAQMHGVKVQSRYVAGLWTSHMSWADNRSEWATHALAWYTLGKDKRSYNQYVAPSFSWASVDAPVKFRSFIDSLSLAEVVNVGTTPVSSLDKFGRLSDGFLTLFAPMVPCTVFSQLQYPNIEVIIHQRLYHMRVFCHLDCSVRRCLVDNGEESEFTLERSPLGQLPFGETVACIILLFRNTRFLFGLLLGRQPSGKGYERLGSLILFPHSQEFWHANHLDQWLGMQNWQEVTIY